MPMRIAATALVLLCAGEAAAQTANRCAITDTTAPAAGSELFPQASGGSAVAKLTGAMIGLRLTQFSSAGGRVHVATGDGKTPYVRVEGFADTRAFRFFARRSIPLVASHVWLTKGLELTVTAVKDDELEIQHSVLGTRGSDGSPQKLTGRIACSNVGLAPPGLDPADAPAGARMFHMKNNDVTLYNDAGGDVVFTLHMDGEARKVFWSTESRAGFVHVSSPGDITIDAWVRPTDLETLTHGEVFDMSSLEPTPLAPKKLALSEPPTMLTAGGELPILAKAAAGAAQIGVVESGARFYTMEVSTEWTSVIPSDLAIMPIDGGGLWVKTSTLPKP